MRKDKLMQNMYLDSRNTTTKYFDQKLIWLSTVFMIDFSRKITLKLFTM